MTSSPAQYIYIDSIFLLIVSTTVYFLSAIIVLRVQPSSVKIVSSHIIVIHSYCYTDKLRSDVIRVTVIASMSKQTVSGKSFVLNPCSAIFMIAKVFNEGAMRQKIMGGY